MSYPLYLIDTEFLLFIVSFLYTRKNMRMLFFYFQNISAKQMRERMPVFYHV